MRSRKRRPAAKGMNESAGGREREKNPRRRRERKSKKSRKREKNKKCSQRERKGRKKDEDGLRSIFPSFDDENRRK